MEKLLRYLMCPFCGSEFDYIYAGKDILGKNYGQLICNCSIFPVVANIPIIKPYFVNSYKIFCNNIINLIKLGRYDEIIHQMLIESNQSGNYTVLKKILHKNELTKKIFNYLQSQIDRRKTGKAYIKHINSNKNYFLPTFLDFLRLFYLSCGKNGQNAYNHFAYRAGQPRHLVALSLLEIIDQQSKCILEIACGFGSITRSAINKLKNVPIIATDAKLFTQYVASLCVAPDALYVNCDANYPLPFKENQFSTIICFDGIHYIYNKKGLINEIARLRDGDVHTLIFGSTRNSQYPYTLSGHPLTPYEYTKLFENDKHIIIPDDQSLKLYLEKKGPQLKGDTNFDKLKNKPLISIIASNNHYIFRNYNKFSDWPHGRGTLSINPLYGIHSTNNDSQFVLTRNFPSLYYLNDNIEYKDYLPDCLYISKKCMNSIKNNEITPEVMKLVESFVALDLPEKYDSY